MPSIKRINASLENHTVVAQDLDNWLIYRDDNGQLSGWISQTKANDYQVCILEPDNSLRTYSNLDTYQRALNVVLGAK